MFLLAVRKKGIFWILMLYYAQFYIRMRFLIMRKIIAVIAGLFLFFPGVSLFPSGKADDEILKQSELMQSYIISDTGQDMLYDANGQLLSTAPYVDDSLFGQDGQYWTHPRSFRDNGDGTVSDLTTGLMWQQDPGDKMTSSEALAALEEFRLGEYKDWRLPTVKELYSLINFNGRDPSGYTGDDTKGLLPFIDTSYFNFKYGDTSQGERIIDSQYLSSTEYVSLTMGGDKTVFGVNFADGRIKGYPVYEPETGREKTFFVMFVRGNINYGINNFYDMGNGTIADKATGLTWMHDDAGPFTWEEALDYAANFEFDGHSDWRLPNAKELQSLVDYERSPATTDSAAIDPLFHVQEIADEEGGKNYPFYWSSTTHANMYNGANAVYVAFGEALGWMKKGSDKAVLMDVHGAGAQRSDPKMGLSSDFPTGHGPQGDVVRISNYVRLVRGSFAEVLPGGTHLEYDQKTSFSERPGSQIERFITIEQKPQEGGPQGGGPPGGQSKGDSSQSRGGQSSGVESSSSQTGPDLEAVAETLGITVDDLMAALGDPSSFGPDTFAIAAEKLGISEEALMEAMGPPPEQSQR
jgi:hypothetical protein